MLLRQRLEEPAPRGECLVLRTGPSCGEADERAELRQEPLRVFVDELPDGALELRSGVLIAVRLEDAGLRLHHLGERPEADAFAVGQRTSLPPVRQLVAALDHLEELAEEAALADPGDADQRHELRCAVAVHPFERPDELVELALASHERRAIRGCQIDAEPRARLRDLPHGNRHVLSFRLDRFVLAVVDARRGGPVRRLADEDAVDRRRRLQPRSRVDDVAGGHPLAELRPRGEIDERLAGIDRDPHLQLALFGDPIADGERGTHGALRIVLACNRSTEQRHHRVPDELLDRPAPPLQLDAQALVVRAQDLGDVLGIELLRGRGEADEIGEEDGDDFPFAHGESVRRRRSVDEERLQGDSRRSVSLDRSQIHECSFFASPLFAPIPLARCADQLSGTLGTLTTPSRSKML